LPTVALQMRQIYPVTIGGGAPTGSITLTWPQQ
jgi:hypothetical protein